MATDALVLRPYPGFRPFTGYAAEYNGKFMVGQLLLRGGSHATPRWSHAANLPQLFPAGSALAVLRIAPCARLLI